MQDSRWFRIVYTLLDTGKCTASELAEKLEVSVRTIYRDLDALSAAGIPVYATQGKGGGGSLLPEYTDEEFAEATFSFVKYYVQSVHYDTLVEENKKLRYELDQEMEWKTRTDG